MNHWNRELYIKAWDFASLHHAGQTFGGPVPGMRIEYINHIGAVVMEIVWVLQQDTHVYQADLAIQCAILHDVIEDTPVSYEQIATEFGPAVADGVMALTKNSQLATKEEQMQDSLARIKKQPVEIWMVKMADRISNLRHPPYYWKNTKITAYQKEAIMIYQELSTANELLATRLQEKIDQHPQFLKK